MDRHFRHSAQRGERPVPSNRGIQALPGAEEDNDLTYGLLDEQKEMVDEALLELDATAEEESRFLYQQGLADGVRLLGILVGPA